MIARGDGSDEKVFEAIEWLRFLNYDSDLIHLQNSKFSKNENNL